MRHFTISTIVPIVHPDSIPVYLRSVDTYQIYDGTRRALDRRHGGSRALRAGGSVLADGLREPGRPRWALHGAGDVGRALEVPRWLDEGVVVRAAR
jgi:hypothetical protein